MDMPARDITLSPGLDIHYFHRAGTGPTVIFLHPSSGYGRMWQDTTANLPPDYNVFAPDQRGHGDSGRPDGEYSAEELSRDLKLFIDKLGLQRVILAGHSLGGRVALCFAAAYPDLTAGLIMVGGPHLSSFYQTTNAVRTVYTTAYKTMVSETKFPSREAALAYSSTFRPNDTPAAWQHRVDYNISSRPGRHRNGQIRPGARGRGPDPPTHRPEIRRRRRPLPHRLHLRHRQLGNEPDHRTERRKILDPDAGGHLPG